MVKNKMGAVTIQNPDIYVLNHIKQKKNIFKPFMCKTIWAILSIKNGQEIGCKMSIPKSDTNLSIIKMSGFQTFIVLTLGIMYLHLVLN
jgi:hypothetical protein